MDDEFEIDGVECIAETAKAILCVLDDGTEMWVPKSQLEFISQVQERGDSGTLVISAWLARQEGLLIDDE